MSDFHTLSPVLKAMLDHGSPEEFPLKAAAEVQAAWEREAARRAFCAAMSAAAGELSPVQRTGKNPHLRNTYGTLDDIIVSVVPVLARHGLRISWSYEPADGSVCAQCRITHNEGHSESCSFSVPVEMGKGVNAAQAHGVAATYARRYSLLGCLAVATADDVDGHIAASAPKAPALRLATEDEVKQISDMLLAVEDVVPGTVGRWQAARGVHYPNADNALGREIPQQHVANIIAELAGKLKKATADATPASTEASADKDELVI